MSSFLTFDIGNCIIINRRVVVAFVGAVKIRYDISDARIRTLDLSHSMNTLQPNFLSIFLWEPFNFAVLVYYYYYILFIIIIIIYFENIHFLHATPGLDVCPYEVPPLIPEYCPFRMQTKHFHLIIRLLSKSSLLRLTPAISIYLKANTKSSTFLCSRCPNHLNLPCLTTSATLYVLYYYTYSFIYSTLILIPIFFFFQGIGTARGKSFEQWG